MWRAQLTNDIITFGRTGDPVEITVRPDGHYEAKNLDRNTGAKKDRGYNPVMPLHKGDFDPHRGNGDFRMKTANGERELVGKLVRIAHEHPKTRKLLLPLISRALKGPKVASSGHDILMNIVDQKGFSKVYSRLLKEDRQSADLLRDAAEELMEAFELTRGQQEALNRLQGLTMRGTGWDVSLIRNNVFKIANSLGLDLPSGMF